MRDRSRQDAKCGMWEVETRAAVSEESERRRGYVLDFLDLDCCGTGRGESPS